MGLTLRQENYTPATTKNAELTYKEGDDNIIYLDQKIETVVASNHTQNTDLYLASETANEVSAADLRSFLDELTITLSDFNTALTGSELTPGRRYFITDLKLHVVAVGGNSISAYGTYDALIPNTDTVQPYWDADTAYAIGDKVMDNFIVYTSLTAHTNATPPASDSTNWVAASTSDATAYTLNTNSCTILWKKSDGVLQINKKIDNNGNEHFMPVELFLEAQNTLDVQSYINIIGHGNGLVVLNNLIRSQINISRYIVGEISSNVLVQSQIYANSIFTGVINACKFYNVVLYLNAAAGVSSQFIQYCNFDFASPKELTIRDGAVLTNYFFNDNESNAVDQLDGGDAVSGATLFLNTNGENDVYGVYEIINNDTTINKIPFNEWPAAGYKKIIVKPAPGRQVIMNTVDTASITDDVIVSDQFGGSFTLVGDRGDYVILEKRYADGSNCVYATHVIIQ